MFRAYPRQSVEFTAKEFKQTLVSILEQKSHFVEKFEDSFAEYIGVKYAESFFSSRAGLYFVLKSLNLKKGDEVIVPSYTFFSIPAMVVLADLRPIFVDADRDTYNINVNLIESLITSRTKVIIVTHLHGQLADMDSIMDIARRYGLRVIEDCAHSCGAEYKERKVGSFDIGCFSFGVGKNLSALGGGMVTMNDLTISQSLKDIKKEFVEERGFEIIKTIIKGYMTRMLTYPNIYFFLVYPVLYISYLFNIGIFNKSPDDNRLLPTIIPESFKKKIPAPLSCTGIEQLKKIEYHNSILKENAAILFEELGNIDLIRFQKVLPFADNIYYHIAVRVKEREGFIRCMGLRGIDIQKDYCSPCAYLDIFKEFKTDCPVSKEISSEMVYIPNHPSLSRYDMRYIAREIRRYFKN